MSRPDIRDPGREPGVVVVGGVDTLALGELPFIVHWLYLHKLRDAFYRKQVPLTSPPKKSKCFFSGSGQK